MNLHIDFGKFLIFVTGIFVGVVWMFLVELYHEYKKMKEYKRNKNQIQNQGFILWTILTHGEGGSGIENGRSLEEESKMQKVCEKICRILTPEEFRTLTDVNPTIKREAIKLINVLDNERQQKIDNEYRNKMGRKR